MQYFARNLSSIVRETSRDFIFIDIFTKIQKQKHAFLEINYPRLRKEVVN